MFVSFIACDMILSIQMAINVAHAMEVVAGHLNVREDCLYIRGRANLTQKQLADLCNVSERYIQHLEEGTRKGYSQIGTFIHTLAEDLRREQSA